MVVNGLYPPLRATAADDGDPAGALWRDRRALNDRELGRLRRRWRGPSVELPLLPLERGPALVAALAGPARGRARTP